MTRREAAAAYPAARDRGAAVVRIEAEHRLPDGSQGVVCTLWRPSMDRRDPDDRAIGGGDS